MSSAVRLKRMFNRMNAKWFGGELPEVTILFKPCDDALARTVHTFTETGELEDVEIWIDPQIAALASTIRAAMLHEMAHVAVDPGGKSKVIHGKKWKAEMDRLWNRGAFFEENCI